METIFPYSGLNREAANSKLIAYLLGSIPAAPVSGDALASALADCEPAEIVTAGPQTLPTNEAAVVVSGSVVFNSPRADSRVIASVGVAVYQAVAPTGFIGYAVFDSPFSFIAGKEEFAFDIECVGGQSL